MTKFKNPNFDTILIQGSQFKESNPITASIVTASTFRQNYINENPEFYYSRCGNPTRATYEEILAKIEHGTYAVALASGSAATSLVLESLPKNSHIIAHKNTYAGTIRLFEKVFKPLSNFTVSYIDLNNLEELELSINQDTKLIWIESPTNPLLEIVDIEAISSIAKKYNIYTCADNTLATSWNQMPLELGCDISILSTSKYISGHSDTTGGAIITNNEKLAEKFNFLKTAIGSIASPFDSYLAIRGIKTLSIRMERICSSAYKIAKALENHKNVTEVIYPGLDNFKYNKIFKKQMKTGGGIVTIRINPDKVNSFTSKLKYFILSESFGGVESIINHSATMSHSHMDKILREELGIYHETFRLSPGIEDPEDLIEDLLEALK
ncbi:MAG: aminotransferase class I/II-fold pyridoxal phosphate-dependent enzyme [Psittacicella sp.]